MTGERAEGEAAGGRRGGAGGGKARGRRGGYRPMADFDWNGPKSIGRDAIESALRLDVLANARNIVLVAPQGLGKTMIAQNICHAAVLAGYSVLFRSAPALLEELHHQAPEGRRRKLRAYANVGLLCIDLCEVVSNVE